MIICDKHLFAFIHIPKCAGTSVRAAIRPFDTRDGMFSCRRDIHPTLGQLDYVHIPLRTLREHFYPEFEAIKSYWSFAVMRDPFARFASSISQRLKMYSDQPIHKRSKGQIRAVVEESIDYLSSQPQNQHRLVPEYIHFQKQVDYIEIEGARMVDNLYTVNTINDLLNDVSQRVGQTLTTPANKASQPLANRTVVFRNDLLRRIIESGRPLSDRLGQILPENAKQRIRDRVYVHRDERMSELFNSERVREFVENYYAEDLALYRQTIKSGRSQMT